MNDNKITMNKHEFWSLRNAHERLAVKGGDVREMVLCAKVRIDNVCTGVVSGDRENRLAYEDDTEHMFEAYRILNEARLAENSIAKEGRKRSN